MRERLIAHTRGKFQDSVVRRVVEEGEGVGVSAEIIPGRRVSVVEVRGKVPVLQVQGDRGLRSGLVDLVIGAE
eukprot:127521-Rhodomonas_salina.1